MIKRAHSTIDKLPAAIRQNLNLMITDAAFPADAAGKRLAAAAEGNPTYDDMVAYLKASGYSLSRSAVGRYAKRIAFMAKMRFSSDFVREIMVDFNEQSANKTQKAVAEMITGCAIEIIANEDLSPKELHAISRAVKDCTAISIKADQHIREQLQAKAQAAANSVDKIVKKEAHPHNA